MTEPALPPGSTIGILGGGQLGRMLALAAARLGMKSHIYCPDPQSPAFDVTPLKTVAAYDDEAALKSFAGAVDLVTYEFENVPLKTAEIVAATTRLAPGAQALEVSQDRLKEKAFLEGASILVAPWRPVASRSALDAALAEIGTPAVLKTARLGYDGKGQRILRAPGDADNAFAALGENDLVLEAFIAFEREISVVAARGRDGTVRCFDAAENVHRDHILKTSTVPAAVPGALAAEAARIAGAIAAALDYVGVLGVEFFVTSKGLLVNEIAPRVHNSGHWTQAVCATDQFEQHVRAILGWPLGDPARFADVVMENLVGDEILVAGRDLGPHAQLHVYGKTETRPGRKMGHVNRVVPRTEPVVPVDKP